MKKTKNLFLVIFVIFTLLLGGCFSFSLDGFGSDSGDSSGAAATLKTFEFVTDEKMSFVEDGETAYYKLRLHAGESYQVQTTVDGKLGEDYYLHYTTEDEIAGELTLSETGCIEVSADLDENATFVIDAELYKQGVSKRIARKYFILSLRVGEYAEITLTNENFTYDENTATYSVTVDSGSRFNIAYSVSYNTAYVLSFALTDPAYSAFMRVDDNGFVTTEMVVEDAVGEIAVRATGANGMLDVVFLKVYLTKSEEVLGEFKVINRDNASEVQDGDTLDAYVGSELSFDVKYNGIWKTDVITVGDRSVLEVDSDTNTVKALTVGASEVVFAYETEQITITVNVLKDKPISIAAQNGGDDFIIINGALHCLNTMTVNYQSGASKEITDNTLISYSVSDNNETHKTVQFTYEEDGEIVSVTYDVKYYVTETYDGQDTAYDNSDYFNHLISGVSQPLPNAGTVKLLVVPVWFTDSDEFFTQAQQAQILEDIEYTVMGNRPDGELMSVKQYYEAQSYGAVTMEFTVSEFYSSDTSYQDYTDNLQSKVMNTHALGTAAIGWYFENHVNENFAEYDLNNDGYLDGLILYYGANYYGAPGDKNKSVAFEVGNNSREYSFNTMIFCPIGGLYGRHKQDPSEQLAAADLSQTYSRPFKSSARTTIHEVGHMFGNVDLYEDQFADERYKPAGGFSMQEDNYGSLDPYHINRIGWSKPQVYASSDYKLGDKVTVHIHDFQSSGQNIILTNKWNGYNSLYDEYLILELFAPTGLNEYDAKYHYFYLNTIQSGIRVWHVNSVLSELHGGNTSAIIDGNLYSLPNSNNDVESQYDLVHMIRNNQNEPYNTTSTVQDGGVLFGQGASFDMQTFASQFINGRKLDNGEKLGWAFTVECIYENADGTQSAVITLERTDNVRTEFSQTVTLNRSDLDTPSGEMDYSQTIFGADGVLSFVYKYVTPPSFYSQSYPISQNGMCLFASADGNGGYIDLAINGIGGKEVCITSISVTYSKLTNASLTVLVDGNAVEGQKFIPENSEAYGFTYQTNGKTIRIQNQYSETIDHWSVLALYELTIHYTIK